nr:immunoglobulin heavy chain junction region [Mus musculus]
CAREGYDYDEDYIMDYW